MLEDIPTVCSELDIAVYSCTHWITMNRCSHPPLQLAASFYSPSRYQWYRWLTPQMLWSMGAHSTQHSVTFIFTKEIQNPVCTFSGSFRRTHPYQWTKGLHDLKLGVCLGALHDSAERSPAPNCHPDTRKAVRQIILDWIRHGSEISESYFFWL